MAQSDIMSAIRQIAAERKIDVEEIITAVRDSIKAVFYSANGIDDEKYADVIQVDMDAEAGQIAVYSNKEVVEKVTDKILEISLEDAQRIDKKVKVGTRLKIDVTPEGDFGRIAAQTARQAILQKLRDAEKEAIIRQFTDKVGKIISVTVQRVMPEGDIICEIGKVRAVMTKDNRISSEFYKLGGTIKVLLQKIEDDSKCKYMLISRSDPAFLAELFRMEIPEIESGTVQIMAVAREAGSRSKVAVKSVADGVDPIGSCIGQRGVRINAISNELKSNNREEKIDIILWDDNIEAFLANSVRPARTIKVEITDKKDKTAILYVPEDELSLAIGKEGQNARLSNKLTGWMLDIRGENELSK